MHILRLKTPSSKRQLHLDASSRKKIRYPGDVHIAECRTLRSSAAALMRYKLALQEKRKKNRALKMKLYRRDKKIDCMKSLLNRLRDDNLISEGAHNPAGRFLTGFYYG